MNLRRETEVGCAGGGGKEGAHAAEYLLFLSF